LPAPPPTPPYPLSLHDALPISSPFPTSPSPKSVSMLSKLVRFLKSHPILFLLLLTPGIPEYLSASSQITLLVVFPPLFFLFLARSEEHTSELQSLRHLVCRLLL